MTRNILALTLQVLSVFLHIVGMVLLLKLYPKSRQKSQRIYLINLALAECLINALEIFTGLVSILGPPSAGGLHYLKEYIDIVEHVGLRPCVYLIVHFIVLDRLAQVVFNLRYTVLWSESKTKALLLLTWTFTILISVTISIVYKLNGFDDCLVVFFAKYIHPPLIALFLVVSLIASCLKFRKCRLIISGKSLREKSRRRSVAEFKISSDYIPTLVISSFILFVSIPDLFYISIGIYQQNNREFHRDITSICFAVSCLLHGYIYLFHQYDVRHFLIKRLKCEQKNARRQDTFQLRHIAYSPRSGLEPSNNLYLPVIRFTGIGSDAYLSPKLPLSLSSSPKSKQHV